MTQFSGSFAGKVNGIADPFSRTVYVNDASNIAGVGALLDLLLASERVRDV